MIIDKSGVAQESIVTLRDTGANIYRSRGWVNLLGKDADAVLLCYSVGYGLVGDINTVVGTYTSIWLSFTKTLKWSLRIREQRPHVPVILVGMMTDKRKKLPSATASILPPHMRKASLVPKPTEWQHMWNAHQPMFKVSISCSRLQFG